MPLKALFLVLIYKHKQLENCKFLGGYKNQVISTYLHLGLLPNPFLYNLHIYLITQSKSLLKLHALKIDPSIFGFYPILSYSLIYPFLLLFYNQGLYIKIYY